MSAWKTLSNTSFAADDDDDAASLGEGSARSAARTVLKAWASLRRAAISEAKSGLLVEGRDRRLCEGSAYHSRLAFPLRLARCHLRLHQIVGYMRIVVSECPEIDEINKRTEVGSFLPRRCSVSVVMVLTGWCTPGTSSVSAWVHSRSIPLGPVHIRSHYPVALANVLRDCRTLRIGCTCPRYPAVPDSTRGTLAAMHILLTCRRASGRQDRVSNGSQGMRTTAEKQERSKIS